MAKRTLRQRFDDWRKLMSLPPHLREFGGKGFHAYASGKTKDFAGRSVEHCISFGEFQDKHALLAGHNSHDFASWGFLYDEGGVYGFDSVIVGFRSEKDAAQYRAWLLKNRERIEPAERARLQKTRRAH